jgi:cell division protein FtsL
MIGRTTLLWLALAAAVVFGLFHVKYRVAALEEELTRLNAATLREQNQIHVLDAEWSYLNRPARLEELADKYLDLKPMTTNQLTTVAELPKRPTLEDFAKDPSVIAKILPPRKPPVPAKTQPWQVPSATASVPSHPSYLPAPVIPVGLAMEGR